MIDLHCKDIAQAALGPPTKRRGGDLLWRCPNHDDHDPSLAVNEAKNCWMWGPCGKGGSAWKLAAFLGGIDPNDKPTLMMWLREHGLLPDSAPSLRGRRPITVQDLAQDKGLPVEFLLRLGLENCPKGVRISYRLMDSTLAPRQRIRTALVAKKGSFWTKGVGEIVPHGLWRLEEARKAGFLVLVEGESDCWTLWFHIFPSLGLPGADMAGKLEAPYLAEINRIYVIRESDDAGQHSSQTLQIGCMRSGGKGTHVVLCFRMRRTRMSCTSVILTHSKRHSNEP